MIDPYDAKQFFAQHLYINLRCERATADRVRGELAEKDTDFGTAMALLHEFVDAAADHPELIEEFTEIFARVTLLGSSDD